jgi:taurine dioxygenase
MTLRVESLPGNVPFGALVRGIRESDLEDSAVRDQLRALWIDRGVLVFRETDATAQLQIALSRVFGELEAHPNVEAHVEGARELVHIRYQPDDGDLCDVDGVIRGGYLPWHSDLVYVDKINRGGILRPIYIPPTDGETGFIDQIAAWSRLPATLQKRIESLDAIYRPDFVQGNKRFGRRVRTLRMSAIAQRIIARVANAPRVLHPMVYVQQETGRRVLNVSPWFALGIHGMENEEGDALLEEVVKYCEDTDYAYVHRWQPDDMVLWDNWRMLHSAYGVAPGDARHMQRTTIRGDYALGRIERTGQDIDAALRVSI